MNTHTHIQRRRPEAPAEGPKHILLVEDESGHAELIRRTLEAPGLPYRLTVVSTLREAQASVTETLPALALVDYRLPDGVGTNLVEQAGGAFPVVLMTAYGSERTAVNIIKAGALDYIVKSPEAFADMPHLIERALREWHHIIERRKAEAALRASENRFRRLLEDTPHVAVQGYAPDGKIIYWNKASEMVYGHTAAEAMGRDITELFLPPEARAEFRAAIRQMVATCQAIPAGELLLVHKNGSRVPVYSSHAVLRGPDGEPQLFCIDMDLTERKRAEAERLEMERRLLHTQKLESLGVLAGGIAHDFNNLLTAILGNLELALMDISEMSPARVSLVDAQAATRRAADLTRQMLAYSGRGRFQIKNISLGELVEEMAQLLKVSIGKTVTLHLHLDRKLPPIQADVAQVQQIVMNLITNASEAIGERVGSITITTEVQECGEACLAQSRLAEKAEPGRYVALVVADTGCGMDAEVQQRLFDPFFTTKFTGRGLGMSAVLGVVRGHRGAIILQSEVGVGTVIRVLFPVADAATVVNNLAVPATLDATAAAPVASRGMVLLVDDEEAILRVTERMLVRAGFQVVCAADGEEALRVLRRRAADITCVLLDLTMPKMDGAKTLPQLRAIRADVPVILASGYDEHEVSKRLDGLGFAGFAQKPFQQESLVALIQRICQPAP